jgi:phosphatidylglycerol---prolipoprotein diacylglyceryl transferase
MFPFSLNLGFNFFPFYEGLYFLTSILIAAFWALKRWGKTGYSEDTFYTVLYAGLGGAVLGGRLSSFIFWAPKQLFEDPLSFFRIWEGGISVSGGVVGGILAGMIVCRIKKIKFWTLMEDASPTILLGQAVGRIGCFLNGDAFGLPTSLPWGVQFRRFATVLFTFKKDKSYSGPAWTWCFEKGLVPAASEYSLPMHPTQIYEGLLDVGLLFLMLFLMKKAVGRAKGKIGFLLVIGGYALIRFLMEFLRADHDPAAFLGMTSFQFTLMGVLAACAIVAPFMLKGPQEEIVEPAKKKKRWKR